MYTYQSVLLSLNRMCSLPLPCRDRVCCEYGGVRLAQSQRCSSLVSPCGELVFTSGAPGELHVWNSATGEHVHAQSVFMYVSACSCDTLSSFCVCTKYCIVGNFRRVLFSLFRYGEPPNEKLTTKI